MYYDTKESGARIKKLRKKNGMTQEILANELGISREFLCRIENGKKGASVDCLVLLSQIYDVPLDYLILGEVRRDIISITEKERALKALSELQTFLKDWL